MSETLDISVTVGGIAFRRRVKQNYKIRALFKKLCSRMQKLCDSLFTYDCVSVIKRNHATVVLFLKSLYYVGFTEDFPTYF